MLCYDDVEEWVIMRAVNPLGYYDSFPESNFHSLSRWSISINSRGNAY